MKERIKIDRDFLLELLEGSDECAIVLNRSLIPVFHNHKRCSLFKAPLDTSFDKMLKDNKKIKELLDRVLGSARGTTVSGEVDVSIDGTDKTLFLRFVSHGSEGENLCTVYVRDVTRSRRMKKELVETNEFLRKIIDNSVDGIIATDMKGNILIFNKGAENILGYKAEEVIGGKINISQIYPPGMAKEVMKKIRSSDYGGRGKLNPIRVQIINKNGERIPISLSASIIYDEDGNEVASVGVFSDLRYVLEMESKLVEARTRLLQAEKMASLGRLAAGVAHEINNPLSGILMFASMMLEDMSEDDPKRKDLELIIRETMRCKEIVKSLLEFSRQSGVEMEPVDVNVILDRELKFLERQAMFSRINIVKQLNPAVPKVLGNPDQLKQVFMNIMVNAADAMPDGGTLTIRTYASAKLDKVYIEFSDTGKGIPPENLGRIFDPFFTTKPVGKGTGLGLSTSYGIVKSHKGNIEVESEVGKGTTFRIELPAIGGEGGEVTEGRKSQGTA